MQERTRDLAEAHEQLASAFSLLERNQIQIQDQNKELIEHRENLEETVRTRTQELKTAKEKAERSDLLKSAFLANMSHEIRTPMNAIMGLLEILRLEDLGEEEQEHYNSVIKQSSQTLLTLIDDILDLSSIEAGEATVSKEPCNIDEVCEELYALFQPIIKTEKQDDVELILEREGIEGITIPAGKESLILEFDQVRLKQILTNLLSNAIKFTDSGEIRFGYESEQRESGCSIRFFVSDTGIGIPSDQLDQIFERFHKVEKDNSRFYRGTGLGLTITRKFAELMGGDVLVKSEIDHGTLFNVNFPNINRFEKSSRDDNLSELPKFRSNENEFDLRSISVLVAEDEEPNYLFIKKTLELKGAKTTWAPDGLKAIELYESEVFDIVLLDMKMPNLNGYEVLQRIRSKDTEIPIIAQTAFAMETDREAAILNGANDFLGKPFTSEQLIESLASCLHIIH